MPTDIADAVRSVDPAAGAELPRVMGIRLSDSQVPSSPSSSKRLPAVTLSLPPQTARAVIANKPILNFKVTSHKPTDIVPRFITLLGTCDSGQLMKANGDLVQPVEVECSGSGGTGMFQLNVTLTEPHEPKTVTLAQTDLGT